MNWSLQHPLGIAMLKWEKCKILEMHMYRHLHVNVGRSLGFLSGTVRDTSRVCFHFPYALCTFDTSPIYNASQSRSSIRRQMLLVCVGLLQARRSNSRALTMVTFVRPFPPVIYIYIYICSLRRWGEGAYIYTEMLTLVYIYIYCILRRHVCFVAMFDICWVPVYVYLYECI